MWWSMRQECSTHPTASSGPPEFNRPAWSQSTIIQSSARSWQPTLIHSPTTYMRRLIWTSPLCWDGLLTPLRADRKATRLVRRHGEAHPAGRRARYVLREPGSGQPPSASRWALSDERPSGDGKVVLKLVE